MPSTMRFRLSLRMFLLLCVGASFLIAWAGLEYQRGDIEAQLSGANRSWKSFGDSGQLWTNSNGQVLAATVGKEEDLAILKAAVECSEIEILTVYSSEGLLALDSSEFPNVKTLSLAGCGLNKGTLLKLRLLPRLQFLQVTELEGDPCVALHDLAGVSTLRHIVLEAGPGIPLTSFPVLDQLRALRLSSPDVTPELISLLQQRLPNCVVTGSD